MTQIKISRVHPVNAEQVLADMREHLVFLEDEDTFRDLYIQQILGNIRERPESLLLITAYKDTELVGYIVAHNNLLSHIHISQLWSKAGNSPKVTDELLIRVMLWAQANGKSRIRGETMRDTEAVLRRSGFVEVSKTVEYTIKDDFMTKLLAISREVIRG